jgi:hypothetical protein
MFLLIVVAVFLGASSPSTPQIAQIEYGAYDQGPPAYNQTNESLHPTPVAEVNRNEGQHHNQNKGAKTNPFLMWCERWQTPINLLTATSVAIFTAVLTIFTVKLWGSGENYSQRELRAYLSVSPLWVLFFNRTPPQQILVEAIIKNHGQTPASEIRNIYEIGVFKPDFQTPETATQRRDSEGTSFPSLDLSVRFFDSKTFSKEEVDDVCSGKRLIFVWGTIMYKDAFNRRWRTDFSANVGGPDFAAWVRGDTKMPPRWTYGNRHNRATEG